MIKDDLVNALSEKSCTYGIAKKDLRVIITELFDVIKEELIEGGEIQVRGFGRFTTKHRAARKINHPSSGKVIMSQPMRIVHFYPARVIKARLREE